MLIILIKFNSKASSPLKINSRNQFNFKNSSCSYVWQGLKRAGYELAGLSDATTEYKSKGTFSTDFEAILMPNYGTLCFVIVYFVIYVFFGSTNFNLSSAPQQPRNEQPSIQDCDITLFTKTCTSGK
jgi:hypothetical protein